MNMVESGSFGDVPSNSRAKDLLDLLQWGGFTRVEISDAQDILDHGKLTDLNIEGDKLKVNFSDSVCSYSVWLELESDVSIVIEENIIEVSKVYKSFIDRKDRKFSSIGEHVIFRK